MFSLFSLSVAWIAAPVLPLRLRSRLLHSVILIAVGPPVLRLLSLPRLALASVVLISVWLVLRRRRRCERLVPVPIPTPVRPAVIAVSVSSVIVLPVAPGRRRVVLSVAIASVAATIPVRVSISLPMIVAAAPLVRRGARLGQRQSTLVAHTVHAAVPLTIVRPRRARREAVRERTLHRRRSWTVCLVARGRQRSASRARRRTLSWSRRERKCGRRRVRQPFGHRGSKVAARVRPS